MPTVNKDFIYFCVEGITAPFSVCQLPFWTYTNIDTVTPFS